MPTETRRTTRWAAGITSTALTVTLAAGLAFAQQGRGAGPHGPGGPGQGMRGRGPMMRHGQGPRRGMQLMKRVRELPPAAQERALAGDPWFQSLPPPRQARFRARLQYWNGLTPQQKQRVREREAIFESLSPQQRQEARDLFPRWRELPPERRQALMRAFRHLRDLPPEQRGEFLSSPQVQNRFSPAEQDILRGLNELLPPHPGRPAPSPNE